MDMRWLYVALYAVVAQNVTEKKNVSTFIAAYPTAGFVGHDDPRFLSPVWLRENARDFSAIPFEPGNDGCWSEDFNFLKCCDVKLYGLEGNEACWDGGQFSFKTCCNRLASERYSRPRLPYRVVVTLTTIPLRINHTGMTFNSLFKQTYPPDAIYLNLPREPIRGDGFPHPLPWFLREARQLTLHWCEYDFSTATNLLCILEEEKDPMTFIIIADDDMVFHPQFVETLVNEQLKFPNMGVGSSGATSDVDNETSGVILSNVYGVAYRRWQILPRVLAYEGLTQSNATARNHCLALNDYWFAAHLGSQALPRVSLLNRRLTYHNTFISFNPHSTFSGGNPLCPRDSPWSRERHMDYCQMSCQRCLKRTFPDLWSNRLRRVQIFTMWELEDSSSLDAALDSQMVREVDRILIRIPLPSPPLPERAPVPPPVEGETMAPEVPPDTALHLLVTSYAAMLSKSRYRSTLTAMYYAPADSPVVRAEYFYPEDFAATRARELEFGPDFSWPSVDIVVSNRPCAKLPAFLGENATVQNDC